MEDSHEARAIKNNAVANYEQEQEQERAEVASNAVGTELGILLTSMAQFPQFEQHMGAIQNSVINLEDDNEVDFENIGAFDCELEMATLIEITDKAQNLVNRSRGSHYENVADVLFNAVDNIALDYSTETF